jgi:predicted membrane-bound spermidine synthase
LSQILPVYFPYSHYSIRYYDLETIVNQIFFSNSRNVLELGSGLSTLCLGLLGKKIPLKVHVLEHDRGWFELMQRLLEMNDINNVKMEYVSLIDFNQDGFSGRFFNLASVQLDSYDSIIVDGPPANNPKIIHSRYPAIHLIKNHLKPDGFFYLDDIDRKGEQEILRAWSKISPFRIAFRNKYGKGQVFMNGASR